MHELESEFLIRDLSHGLMSREEEWFERKEWNQIIGFSYFLLLLPYNSRLNNERSSCIVERKREGDRGWDASGVRSKSTFLSEAALKQKRGDDDKKITTERKRRKDEEKRPGKSKHERQREKRRWNAMSDGRGVVYDKWGQAEKTREKKMLREMCVGLLELKLHSRKGRRSWTFSFSIHIKSRGLRPKRIGIENALEHLSE